MPQTSVTDFLFRFIVLILVFCLNKVCHRAIIMKYLNLLDDFFLIVVFIFIFFFLRERASLPRGCLEDDSPVKSALSDDDGGRDATFSGGYGCAESGRRDHQ